VVAWHARSMTDRAMICQVAERSVTRTPDRLGRAVALEESASKRDRCSLNVKEATQCAQTPGCQESELKSANMRSKLDVASSSLVSRSTPRFRVGVEVLPDPGHGLWRTSRSFECA
jgi:hypothetical protein